MIRLPNFFIVGASKAGTTAICDALASHPDICFSERKEPNFFSKFNVNLQEIPADQLMEYTKLFPIHSPKQLMGEGSVAYLTSHNAVYWIKKYNPAAKIVIVLRNPIQRIVSLYEMYCRLGMMKMSPEEAFSGNNYLVKQCLLYEDIKRYINAFFREQIFIMLFDDLTNNPMKELNNLYNFLGVEETVNSVLSLRNQGGLTKSKLLGFLTNQSLIKIAKDVLPKSKHAQVDNFIKSMFFKKTKLTSNQKEELENIFYYDVVKIGNLIDQDLVRKWQIYGSSNK